MERLPPVEEQEWMLDCLRLLVRRRGAEPLLQAPLWGPRRRDLGPWSPTPRGVGAVLRRLLDHLDLHGVEVRVLAAAAPDVDRCVGGSIGPVWLGGLVANTAWFACDPSRLPGSLREAAGLLVGPAVQVWRQARALEVEDPSTEDKLRDLSSVYLGLGVLAAHRAEAWRQELGARALLATGRGGLGPVGLAYLLAAQVLVRRMSCLQTVHIARMLGGGPRRSFLESLRHLRRMPGGVAWRLRLPGEDGPSAARLPPKRRAGGPVLGALERALPHRGLLDPE